MVVDTGASAAFSFFLQDFINFRPYEDSVEGLGSLKVKGIGTIRYHIINDNNKLVTLTIKNAFYVLSLKIRLLTPQ